MFTLAAQCLQPAADDRPKINDVYLALEENINNCKAIQTDPVLRELTEQMDACGLELEQQKVLSLLKASVRDRTPYGSLLR